MKRAKVVPIVVVALIAVVAGVAWSRFARRDDPNRIRLSGNIELTLVDVAF